MIHFSHLCPENSCFNYPLLSIIVPSYVTRKQVDKGQGEEKYSNGLFSSFQDHNFFDLRGEFRILSLEFSEVSPQFHQNSEIFVFPLLLLPQKYLGTETERARVEDKQNKAFPSVSGYYNFPSLWDIITGFSRSFTSNIRYLKLIQGLLENKNNDKLTVI